MTRIPKQELLIFSRETQLESGEHHIDALDSEGVPIRLCTKSISRAHILSPQTAPIPRETANDQIATARAMGALQNE